MSLGGSGNWKRSMAKGHAASPCHWALGVLRQGVDFVVARIGVWALKGESNKEKHWNMFF